MAGPGYAAFGEAEVDGVRHVLDHWRLSARAHSDPLGEDSQVRRFEAEAARTLGARYCLAVSGVGAALATGLAALGVGPGDEIVVPGYLPPETLAGIRGLGAVPVPTEIDGTLTLDPAQAATVITSRTRAVLAVHTLGAPGDLAALGRLAAEHDLYLVEDVSQACGGSYRGQRLGTFGDAGAFSLDVFGTITGCGGGFLLTGDHRVVRRARALHDDSEIPWGGEDDPGDALFGLELGMNEFTAAVARAQLAKLDTILARTRQLADDLAALLPDRPGMRRRAGHDPAGDCAGVLVHLFDDAEAADAVAARLGSRTLLHTSAGSRARSSADLPRTRELLGRSVAVTVGVSDRDRGAVFGVSTFSGPDQIDAVAEKIRDSVAEVLGG